VIKIDQEFQAYIPPLSNEEVYSLETSLICEGCRDALVVWKEEGILLDGHHRKAICEQHNIDYNTVEISLPDRDSALVWMIDNQLARRNLPFLTRTELVRSKRELLERRAIDRHGTRVDLPDIRENFPESERGRVRAELGKEVGVSGRTYEAYETVLDKGVPELIESVRVGKLGASTAAEVAMLPQEEQSELCALDGKAALIEAARQRKARRQPHVLISQSNSNEWYTPHQYISAAREVMGSIDLDPASSKIPQMTVEAETFYSKDDDGLLHEWRGNIWLNPPWGQVTADFIAKLSQEMEAGRVGQAIVLVNAHATDTKWFSPLWYGLLCFTNHRINYHMTGNDPDSGSTHGSVFIYFGPNRKRFIELFSKWGTIVERVLDDNQE